MTASALLVYPPYGDYTYPYHSLAYVAAPLQAAGYDVEIVDLNAEWFRAIFTASRLAAWREAALGEFGELDALRRWTADDQDRAVRALQTIALTESIHPQAAIDVLRGDSFYDFGRYSWARAQVRHFERLLALRYPSYDFYTAFAIPPFEAQAAGLIDAALQMQELIEDVVILLRRRFPSRTFSFCGVSMPFSSHLRPGVAVLEAIGRVFPGARRIAGGTAISDVWKYRGSDRSLLPFAAVCDDLMIGESDETIVPYAAWVAGAASDPPRNVVRLRGSEYAAAQSPPFFDVRERSVPPYDWIDWDLYLSPERQVNYSPSRGCFWNRCTFCDYGLNVDTPAAPSRTMDAASALDDIRALVDQGIRQVYLAVDAIAPAFLKRFASGLIERGISVRWSAEFFLTPQFDTAFVSLLERSGLVTASFGLESASSRVLETMGKGPGRRERVLEPVVAAFRSSGIGLQPKYFFGFPGETDDERWETARFLVDNRDVFSVVTNCNVFALTAGSLIAREPEAFGIASIQRCADDDIGGSLEYVLADGKLAPNPSSYGEFRGFLDVWSPFERPWAGGIDTFHTKLYLDRFGRGVFHTLRELHRRELPVHASTTVSSRFDIDEAFEGSMLRAAVAAPCMREMLGADDPSGLADVDRELAGSMRPGPAAAYDIAFS